MLESKRHHERHGGTLQSFTEGPVKNRFTFMDNTMNARWLNNLGDATSMKEAQYEATRAI